MTIALTGGVVNDNYNYQAPATGATITLNDYDWHLIVDPAAGIATLTVKMCANPHDGQRVDVLFSQSVTTLTVSGNTGQSIANGAPTTIAAGQSYHAVYRSTNTTWYVAV